MTGLTMPDRRRIKDLRELDGMSIYSLAPLYGVHPVTIHRIAPGMPGKICNEGVREAFEASGVSSWELAKRLGWRKGDGRPNTWRVLVTLGKREGVNGDGTRTLRRMVDAETIGNVSEALGFARWSHGGC